MPSVKQGSIKYHFSIFGMTQTGINHDLSNHYAILDYVIKLPLIQQDPSSWCWEPKYWMLDWIFFKKQTKIIGLFILEQPRSYSP